MKADLHDVLASEGTAPAVRVPLRVWLLGAAMAVSLGTALWAFWSGWLSPESLRAMVTRAGPAGAAAFVAGVTVMELLWMPRAWGLLAGGLLFGPILGGILTAAGDLLGASGAYLLSRGVAGRWAASALRSRPRARLWVALLARRRGLLTVALLRTCPVAHFTATSYAAGLAGVPPAAFLAGTALGMVPAALVYPLLGHAALSPGSPIFFVSLAAIVVFLVVTLLLGRRLLRAAARGEAQ